jgi:D-alanyl-lipoteichoic acid acyltransferase DltB (MBOAT superfamily)
MLFPSAAFAIFFLIVYTGHRLLLPYRLAWTYFMLGASYFFYGYWDWRFVGLLVVSSTVNHAIAVLLHKAPDGARRRRTLMVLALIFNLGTLGYFKYYGFFTMQVYAVCARMDWSVSLPLLDIILPVGISFFTFQAMSYVIDVYRRELEPTRNWAQFAVYLAFFPQLVAGPIVRAKVFLPQLDTFRDVKSIDVGRATALILCGLFKKIVIANTLSQQLVDPVFANPSAYGALDNLFAVYGYAIQIYCDFSAYSDIAIGIALLMGFHFPLNFNAPYFAVSIQDFWRRWHISLSTWLRDYLYIPLGGSKGSSARTYRNLFLTFLLGGLWHGAAWTFVMWGALHGAYLMLERVVATWRGKKPTPEAEQPLWAPGRILRMVWVFHLVCLSWIFFRAETFADATDMVRQLFTGDLKWAQMTGVLAGVMIVGWLSQFMDGVRMSQAWNRFSRWHPVVQGATAAVILIAILALGPKGVSPFIYFQF